MNKELGIYLAVLLLWAFGVGSGMTAILAYIESPISVNTIYTILYVSIGLGVTSLIGIIVLGNTSD